MSADALVFRDVTKRYGLRGTKALDGLSFRVPRGAIAGLVGPNGAGKTTCFAVAAGYVRIGRGSVDVLGEGPFDAARHAGRLGVLPQDAELPVQHTPRELLEHLGRLQGMSAPAARAEADRMLALVRLSDRARHRIATLSHGMRRRVAVATALIGNPELVLLDEPTSGLDPVEADALRTALAGLRGERTVVVSSHQLDELERLCDWLVTVQGGRCTGEGPLADFIGRGTFVRWTLSPGPLPLERLAARLPGHRLVVRGEVLEQQAPSGADLDAASRIVVEELLSAGIAVREVRRGESLERRFVEGALGAAG